MSSLIPKLKAFLDLCSFAQTKRRRVALILFLAYITYHIIKKQLNKRSDDKKPSLPPPQIQSIQQKDIITLKEANKPKTISMSERSDNNEMITKQKENEYEQYEEYEEYYEIEETESPQKGIRSPKSTEAIPETINNRNKPIEQHTNKLIFENEIKQEEKPSDPYDNEIKSIFTQFDICVEKAKPITTCCNKSEWIANHKNEYQKIFIKCDGCQTLCERKSIHQHTLYCPEVFVKCETCGHGCTVLRKDTQSHLLNEMYFRMAIIIIFAFMSIVLYLTYGEPHITDIPQTTQLYGFYMYNDDNKSYKSIACHIFAHFITHLCIPVAVSTYDWKFMSNISPTIVWILCQIMILTNNNVLNVFSLPLLMLFTTIGGLVFIYDFKYSVYLVFLNQWFWFFTCADVYGIAITVLLMEFPLIHTITFGISQNTDNKETPPLKSHIMRVILKLPFLFWLWVNTSWIVVLYELAYFPLFFPLFERMAQWFQEEADVDCVAWREQICIGGHILLWIGFYGLYWLQSEIMVQIDVGVMIGLSLCGMFYEAVNYERNFRKNIQ